MNNKSSATNVTEQDEQTPVEAPPVAEGEYEVELTEDGTRVLTPEQAAVEAVERPAASSIDHSTEVERVPAPENTNRYMTDDGYIVETVNPETEPDTQPGQDQEAAESVGVETKPV